MFFISILGIIPVRDTVWGIVLIVLAVLCTLIFVPMFLYLAIYGTRSFVKSVMIPNQPTPLLNATDCGENAGLLTSSEAVTNCWPGTSYERSYSFSYGSAQNAEPSAKTQVKKKHRSDSAGNNAML